MYMNDGNGCAEMDAETCPSPAASATDSGAMGGHLPHDLLHDPDESAGGAVLLRGSGKLDHEADRRRRSPEDADTEAPMLSSFKHKGILFVGSKAFFLSKSERYL